MSIKWIFIKAAISEIESSLSNFTLKLNKTFGWKWKSSSYVPRIDISPTGKMFLFGNFKDYGGISYRDAVVKFNSDKTIDSSFCSNAVDNSKIFAVTRSHEVRSVKENPQGAFYIGGFFENYGLLNRNHLIKVNSDGTLDTSFCANATDDYKIYTASATMGGVTSIEVQPDDKILVAGNFKYGGYNNLFPALNSQNLYSLIRLNPDGTLDTSFCTNASANSKFNKGASSNITSLILQSDGKILVAGSFTNYNAVTGRSRLIRLNSDGTLDTSFCANAVDGAKFNSVIYSAAPQSDGKILVAGNFTNYGGTTGRSYLVRLNSDGTLDTSFCANAVDGAKFSSSIRSVLSLSDDNIVLSGTFTGYGSVADYIVKLNSDGTIAAYSNFFKTGTPYYPYNIPMNERCLDVFDDSSILCGTSNGVTNYGSVFRLKSDLTLD